MTLFKQEHLSKWVVRLQVTSTVTLSDSGEYRFRQRKDFDSEDPLYSNVLIEPRTHRRHHNFQHVGFDIEVNAYAQNNHLARVAAHTFVGFALDCLSVHTGCYFLVNPFEERSSNYEANELREITLP